jgi:4-hydroxyphenylpyruvate dioxygenase
MAQDEYMPIRNWDHIEFYVGNAKQAAHYYATTFGFTQTAYAGLETGVRDRASYVLEQGKIRLVLTSALTADSPISEHVRQHGDGVKDIALEVPDAAKAYQQAIAAGARSALEPTVTEDSFGQVRRSAIYTYGETLHTFVERMDYAGVFLPGFKPVEAAPAARQRGVGLAAIDHIVGNVEEGKMNEWVKFYQDVLGFHQLVHFDDKDISTEYSALMSKVVENGTGRIKFPINEPAKAKRRSQIDEFLQFYGGPGVQHIAMATDNIIETVKAMRDNDVSFLRVPQSYYDMLPERVGAIKEDIDVLADLGILVDRDDEGYMLQIFTKPVADRPTLFFEVIQRRGSRSFGKGNFKALFEAIEREQAVRGTL